MADITVEELAKFMGDQIPMTFAVFDEHRHEDAEHNTASWARGRIDAYFQILEILDKERLEVLRAQWEQVVKGEKKDEDDGE